MHTSGEDFSQHIDILVDQAIDAASKGETKCLGTFFGFPIVIQDRCLLFGTPQNGWPSLKQVADYLVRNGWGNNGGFIFEGYRIRYLDADRIPCGDRREKLKRELYQLKKLMEGL